MVDMTQYTQDADTFYREAFARNIGLLTEKEQARMRQARVGIVGAGGVGGFHLTTLVRLGVGHFHLADYDQYEIANIQRQCGAFVDTLGENKAVTMKKIAVSINPHVEVKEFTESISPENIDRFLEGVEVVIDGIDFFSFDARRLLFNKAREKGIYTITAGPLGFGSALLIFAPRGQGMSFDEYFDITDGMSYQEKIVAFGVGLAPAALHLKYLSLGNVDLERKKGPSVVSACTLCGAIAATEAVNILLERNPVKCAPHYFQFDPYRHLYKHGYLVCGNRNPVQRLKRWYLLRRLSRR
ncbi:MAG: ThiF family adenylyltransferase [Candidatus Omnitrophica bacterium]|nr:ThiF family adenylyltransferase [Candidatus Omnitrophota bacterium]